MSQEIDPCTIEISSEDFAPIDRQLEDEGIEYKEDDGWDVYKVF